MYLKRSYYSAISLIVITLFGILYFRSDIFNVYMTQGKEYNNAITFLTSQANQSSNPATELKTQQLKQRHEIRNSDGFITDAADDRRERCPDHLKAMEHGHWISHTPPPAKLAELKAFLKYCRSKFLFVPINGQRKDKLCGNITFPARKNAFRALCDVDGSTPCCEHGRCVSRPQGQCVCEDCIDMRAEVIADFATYKLDNPACEMQRYSTYAEVCSVLRGITVTFVGDSIVDQVYTTALGYLKQWDLKRMFYPVKHNRTMQECQGEKMYISDCRYNVRFQDSEECGASTKITFRKSFKMDSGWEQGVKELIGVPHSIVVIGIGLHEGFPVDKLRQKVLQPLLAMRGSNKWPLVIWYLPHLPGLLKTPFQPPQSRERIMGFAPVWKDILEKVNISYVDPIPLTNGVLSYDGTHYGRAINEIKVQILLNAIKRLKNNEWTSMK